MQHKNVSPARYFLIYIAFGMLSLLTIIVISTYFRSQQNEVTWPLAVAILISNFIAVWGYSIAILKREDLLADPEAPDLAYYLGFSLTVGALSFSFLADLGVMKVANPQLQASLRSGLVSGSLAQFGAGLLATLIGLCFKIYLSSKQQRASADPTQMYNQFRTEVGSFSSMLRNLSSDLTSSINLASAEIIKSGNTASSSMTEMSATLQRASQTIAVNITNEKISAPIERFVSELESISLPLKDANEVLVDFVKHANEANLAIKSAASEYLAASQIVRQSAISIDALSKSANNLNPDLEELNIKLGDFLTACYSGTNGLNSLTENINLTSSELANNIIKYQELNLVVFESIEVLKTLSTGLNQVTEDSKLLNRSVLDFVDGAINAKNASNEFSEILGIASQNTNKLSEKVDGFSVVCSDSLITLQNFQQAAISSTVSANNFGQSIQLSAIVVESTTANLSSFSDSIASAKAETHAFVNITSEFVSKTNDTNNSMEGFSVLLNNTNQSVANFDTQLNSLSIASQNNLIVLQNLERTFISVINKADDFGRRVDNSTQSIENTSQQINLMSDFVSKVNSEIINLISSTNNFNIVTNAQISSANENRRQLDALTEKYNNILDSLSRQQQVLGDLDIKLRSLVGAIPNVSNNLNS